MYATNVEYAKGHLEESRFRWLKSACTGRSLPAVTWARGARQEARCVPARSCISEVRPWESVQVIKYTFVCPVLVNSFSFQIKRFYSFLLFPMPTLQKPETVCQCQQGSENSTFPFPTSSRSTSYAEKGLCFPLMAALRKVKEPVVSGSQEVSAVAVKLYKL